MANLALAGIRVLIAEDQMIVAMQLEDLLREMGCEVVGVVSTLESAMILAGQTVPDVAILDVNLDGIQSFPLAMSLRERHIPTILATGYSASSLPQQWRSTILNKPFTRAQLEAVLSSVVLSRSGDSSH